jgi:hypothetical protein
MSHRAIAAALALGDISAGERPAAFSLASFANPQHLSWPGAGCSRSTQQLAAAATPRSSACGSPSTGITQAARSTPSCSRPCCHTAGVVFGTFAVGRSGGLGGPRGDGGGDHVRRAA